MSASRCRGDGRGMGGGRPHVEQQTETGPAVADTVVGVFERDRLSGALVALHRAGFGPHARVLDGARGDLAGQLRRSALDDALDPAALDAGLAVVVVSAPGRAALVADT